MHTIHNCRFASQTDFNALHDSRFTSSRFAWVGLQSCRFACYARLPVYIKPVCMKPICKTQNHRITIALPLIFLFSFSSIHNILLCSRRVSSHLVSTCLISSSLVFSSLTLLCPLSAYLSVSYLRVCIVFPYSLVSFLVSACLIVPSLVIGTS